MPPNHSLIKLSKSKAREIIRDAALDSRCVFVCPHAQQQMAKRKITMTQLFRVLKDGVITEGPAPDLMKGNWTCRVEKYSAGETIGVAVALDPSDPQIVVITVMFVK